MKAVWYLIVQSLKSLTAEENFASTIFFLFVALIAGLVFGIIGHLLWSINEESGMFWGALVNSGIGFFILIIRLLRPGTFEDDIIPSYRPVSGLVRFSAVVLLNALSNFWLAWLIMGLLTFLIVPHYGLLWFLSIPFWILFLSMIELILNTLFECKVTFKIYKALLFLCYSLIFFILSFYLFAGLIIQPDIQHLLLRLIFFDLSVPNPFDVFNAWTVLLLYQIINIIFVFIISYWIFISSFSIQKPVLSTPWLPLSVVMNNKLILKAVLFVLFFKGYFLFLIITSFSTRGYHDLAFQLLFTMYIFFVFNSPTNINFMGAFPNLWRHLSLSANSYNNTLYYYCLMLMPFLIIDLFINTLIIIFLIESYYWFLIYILGAILLLHLGFIFSVMKPNNMKGNWSNSLRVSDLAYGVIFFFVIFILRALFFIPYGWLLAIIIVAIATFYLQRIARRLFNSHKNQIYEQI